MRIILALIFALFALALAAQPQIRHHQIEKLPVQKYEAAKLYSLNDLVARDGVIWKALGNGVADPVAGVDWEVVGGDQLKYIPLTGELKKTIGGVVLGNDTLLQNSNLVLLRNSLTRAKLCNIQDGNVDSLVVLLIGDSQVNRRNNYSRPFKEYVWANYGYKGTGWQSASTVNANPMGAFLETVGSVTNIGYGNLAGGLIDDAATLNNVGSIRGFSVVIGEQGNSANAIDLYYAKGTGDFRLSGNGMTTVTVENSSGSGVGKYTVTYPAVSNYALYVEALEAGVKLYGINRYVRGASGVLIHKAAANGFATFNLDALTLQASHNEIVSYLNPDLIIVILSTNLAGIPSFAGNNTAPTGMAEDLDSVYSRYTALIPKADFTHIGHPDKIFQSGYVHRTKEYDDVFYTQASQKGYSYISQYKYHGNADDMLLNGILEDSVHFSGYGAAAHRTFLTENLFGACPNAAIPENISAFTNDAGYLTSQPWTISGSNIYRSTGFVGIGEYATSPIADLYISGNTARSQFAIAGTGNSGSYNILSFGADNVSTNFDVAWGINGSGWRASDATGAQFYKISDRLNFRYFSGATVGGTVSTFNESMSISLTDGSVRIPGLKTVGISTHVVTVNSANELVKSDIAIFQPTLQSVTNLGATTTNITTLQGLRVRGGATATEQIRFGWTNTDSYAHTIKTRHNGGADTGNNIDLFTWDQGTDAIATPGTFRAATFGTGNSEIASPLTLLAPLAMSSQKITGLATGTAGTDAVNKAQMDAAITAAGGADGNGIYSADGTISAGRIAQGYDRPAGVGGVLGRSELFFAKNISGNYYTGFKSFGTGDKGFELQSRVTGAGDPVSAALTLSNSTNRTTLSDGNWYYDNGTQYYGFRMGATPAWRVSTTNFLDLPTALPTQRSTWVNNTTGTGEWQQTPKEYFADFNLTTLTVTGTTPQTISGMSITGIEAGLYEIELVFHFGSTQVSTAQEAFNVRMNATNHAYGGMMPIPDGPANEFSNQIVDFGSTQALVAQNAHTDQGDNVLMLKGFAKFNSGGTMTFQASCGFTTYDLTVFEGSFIRLKKIK